MVHFVFLKAKGILQTPNLASFFFFQIYFSILLILLANSLFYFLEKDKKTKTTDELTLETFSFFLATKSEPTLSGPVIYISNDFCRLCPDSQRN